VVVVQANAFNASLIGTAIVAVITSNLALAAAPGNVRLARSVSGLSKPSVVNVSQLLTIDRGILTERVGMLPADTIARIDDGLRLVLAL
jgi:mRNA interferase MazF